MKTRILATIFLHPTSEQFQMLQASQEAYRDAWNVASRSAFEQKTCTTQALRAEILSHLRQQFHLPSPWARRIVRDVSRLYQGLWKKVQHTATQRGDGRVTKRYTLLTQAPLSAAPLLSYQYGKGYTFTGTSCVSILTLDGRLSIPYTCDQSHVALIQQGTTIGEANLWYDTLHKTFSLLVTLEIEKSHSLAP